MANEFKVAIILSSLYVLVGSSWFDNWLKEVFPAFATMDSTILLILKAVAFSAVYFLVNKLQEKFM